MRESLKHYTPVALLLAGLVLFSAVGTMLIGSTDTTRGGQRVLAVNYPLYIAAREVVGDTDAVSVEQLAGNATGCLHDYQLSPGDRLAISRADMILTVGDTPFLEGIADPAKVVDLAEGLEPLCADHDHEHGHDHHETINDHVWMSPWRYKALVHGVAEALATIDTAHAAAYLANDDRFGGEIDRLRQQLQTAAAALPSRRCVLFHDSLAYLADDLGLTVSLSLDVGEDSGVSAGDLAAVSRLAAEEPGLLLLYDDQYTVRYVGVDGLVPSSQVLRLDTVVSGDRQGNDWLDAMRYNVKVLQEAGR